MQFEFEWKLSSPAPDGTVTVVERLVGTELINTYQLPNTRLAEATIKTRRAFIHRTVTTRLGAMQIFSPRGHKGLIQ